MKNKLNKRSALIAVIASALVLALAITLLGLGIKSNLGISPAEATNSVVFVYAEAHDAASGNYTIASGSGWAIGVPGEKVQYIVTNAHVVEDAFNWPKVDSVNRSGAIDVYYSAAENDAVRTQVVFYSEPEDKDIAILKLPAPTDKRQALVLRPSSKVKPNDTAIALGFPSVASQAQSNVRLDIKDVNMTRGIISKRVALTTSGYEAFQTDAKIYPGSSGGPLIDEHGFVLGVNTCSLISGNTGEEMGVNYASVADELIRILREEGYNFRIKGYHNWMIYLGSPLSVLALLALIFFTLRYLKLRKLAPVAGMPGAPASAKGPAGKNPCLRGISGKYAGVRFELNKGKLTLGRDAGKCNIVFDASTPGISGSHCSLYYDSNTEYFVLTDNASSFGTFLGNGKKLTPAVPEKLSAGDSFYLADVNNRFIVAQE